MAPDIRLDMRLNRLLESYPQTRPVFAAHGLGGLVSDESLRAVGPFLTLETALLEHGVSPAAFLRLLQESCRPQDIAGAPGLKGYDRCPDTFLAMMPCGLKVPFAHTVGAFLQQLQLADGAPLDYAMESNVNHELSYYPFVSHIQALDELPDIVVSSDFNAFFHHRFQQRFVAPGHFVDVTPYAPNAAFAAAGISDPLRHYTILCVNPLIIVADLAKVGQRPLPRRWSDLLDPMWAGSITLRGNDQFFCHAVLLPLYKEHGAAAMPALARNIFDGRHPAEMVKTAGSGRSAALYVMPDFFSRKIPERRPVARIWPEDGALASPVTLLVKKEKAGLLKPITDYLTGEALARLFAGAHFPSPHPLAAVDLPAGGLKWLGWDYIRQNDIEALNAEIDRLFLPAVAKGAGA